jgi:L-tartrate/succinate antiporter
LQKGTGHALTWGVGKNYVTTYDSIIFINSMVTYVIYPPTQKKSPEAPAWAAEELKKLGSITFKEYLMAGLATVALVLWIFGKELGVDSTTTAISIVSIMVLSGIITWDDLLSNKAAFNVFIWFATLSCFGRWIKKSWYFRLDW